MYKKLFLISLFALLLPFLCLASDSIIINEIAWMGTIEFANDEWIELYNPTDQEIDLTGWILKAEDDTPNISLTGTIASQGYFLLERTDDSSVPDIIADQIYTGALGNNGELLELYDAENHLIDSASYPKDGPPGDNTTRQTMERTSSGEWQTSQDVGGTPKAINSAGDLEPTDPETDPEPENTDANDSSDTKHASNYPPYAEAGPDITALSNQEIFFDGSQSWDPDANNLDFFWNFGDGATDTSATTTHTYTTPGQYIATLQVSDSQFSDIDILFVNIYNSSIIISEFIPNPEGKDEDGEWIEIHNQSDSIANLSGWQLDDEEGGSNPFVFPENSLIAPKQFLVLRRQITKISLNNDSDSVRLIYPNGEIASHIDYKDINEKYSVVSDGLDYYWTNILTPGTANIVSNNSISSSNPPQTPIPNNPKPVIEEPAKEPIALIPNVITPNVILSETKNLVEEQTLSNIAPKNTDVIAIQAQNISDKIRPLLNSNNINIPKKSNANLILVLSILISGSLFTGWGITIWKKKTTDLTQ
ncbi:MAG: lamin tail domain-containing protein [bacterium]